jgi:competence protein ComEA
VVLLSRCILGNRGRGEVVEHWRPEPPIENAVAISLTSKFKTQAESFVSYLVKTGAWFGWGRLITMCACIPLVGFGAFFLLRTPAPPVEASLTYASTVVSSGPREDSQVPTTVATVSIHVAGNVLKPGVYEMPADSRVVDAIRIAGGANAIADLNAINLANRLNDAQQVYVPAVGEKVPPSSSGLSAGGVGTGSAPNSVEYPININSADVALLDELPGVGPSTAQAIVTYRDQNGPFASVSGLEDVPGIGPAKVAAIQRLVTT